jgi:hypothetical protein
MEPVWVKLVIDGVNVGQAFQVKITSETKIVDDLKDTIIEKAKSRDMPSFNGGSGRVQRRICKSDFG